MTFNPYKDIKKWFFHTKIGMYVGFHLGIRGFNRVVPVVREVDGTIRRYRPSYNSRVDVGAALTSSLMSGSTLGGISSPLPPKYIALSTSSLTPAKTDTTLSGETSATGLARAVGTVGGYSAPSTLDGAASYTIQKTFTNSSGGSVTLLSSALFDASSSGNMFTEANLSQTIVLANGAQVTITWTVNN